ncbi:hypothetical protein L0657_14845 [Dyadobacter sp. CY345]|uniref:hypothetical protein n=1 Tax=Dyadobacter sp. CY345 TaxID=2909335 RepID=UPI001F360149|nr:hypothetical protein [Dyadobacter sp. CY345]MCF2445244.1 hypothetical protein [Dyadobacter sp. CY345]
MKTKKVINQTISLLLATMLLMVAGAKSWTNSSDTVQQFSKSVKAIKGVSNDVATGTPDENQATVSALALDAVITPAISFDFSHYFYFAPQPVWQFIESQQIVETSVRESYFLFSCFSRVFARYIVTNAP